MTRAINGVNRNRQIVLDETPSGITEAIVRVEFLDAASTASPRIMTFGMLAMPGHLKSTLEDFKVAEHDDSRWDRD